MMTSLLLLLDLAGLAIFAVPLWRTRARLPGLAACALSLLLDGYRLARPLVVDTDSWWVWTDRWTSLLTLVSQALLLGAIYALRDPPSSLARKIEGILLAGLAGVVLVALGLATLSPTDEALSLLRQLTLVVLNLLGVAGLAVRLGTAPAALVGMAGFFLRAAAVVVPFLTFGNADEPGGPASSVLAAVLAWLGTAAVLGGFALVANHPALERQPCLGVASLGMNRNRWTGAFMILGWSMAVVVLGYFSVKDEIFANVRGRGWLVVWLLPAYLLYLVFVGVQRLATGGQGTPLWYRMASPRAPVTEDRGEVVPVVVVPQPRATLSPPPPQAVVVPIPEAVPHDTAPLPEAEPIMFAVPLATPLPALPLPPVTQAAPTAETALPVADSRTSVAPLPPAVMSMQAPPPPAPRLGPNVPPPATRLPHGVLLLAAGVGLGFVAALLVVWLWHSFAERATPVVTEQTSRDTAPDRDKRPQTTRPNPEEDTNPVVEPADATAAVLDVVLPPGAALNLDGKNQGKRRRFVFAKLPADKHVEHEIVARFADGSKVRRQVLLRAGWRVRLSLTSPFAQPTELILQHGYPWFVLQMVFSPDGKHLLTGGSEVCLWEVATGRLLRTYPDARGPVAFVAGGKHFLALRRQAWARPELSSPSRKEPDLALWDTVTGRELRSFQADGDWSWSTSGSFLAVSDDGQRVVVPRAEGPTVWDLKTGKRLRTLPKEAWCYGPALSPDGQQVLTTNGEKCQAQLWDVATGQVVRTFKGKPSGYDFRAIFSPDGKYVLAGPDGKEKVRLWDKATGKQQAVFLACMAGPIRLSANNKLALVVSYDGIRLWDVATGQKGHELNLATIPFQFFKTAAIAPDGKYVVTAIWDLKKPSFRQEGGILLWDAQTGRQVRELSRTVSRPSVLAWSPDHKQLAVAHADSGRVVVWQSAGAPLSLRLDPTLLPQLVGALVWTADGQELLTCASRGWGEAWSPRTGTLLRTIAPWGLITLSENTGMAWSPDGKRLLVRDGSGNNKIAVLYDTVANQLAQRFLGHQTQVALMAFTPDSKQVLTVQEHGKATLWGCDTGLPVHTFPKLGRGLATAFSPDGKFLVDTHCGLPAARRVAGLWDVAAEKLVRELEGHTSDVTAVAFSPDGKLLLTGSFDRTAILWDVPAGRPLQSFVGHTQGVNAVAFGPSDRHVLTGSDDGTLRLWDLATGDEIGRLISMANGKDWLVVTPEGLYDGSADGRERCWVRVGNGLKVAPLGPANHRPGLLTELWSSQRPLPGDRLPDGAANTPRP